MAYGSVNSDPSYAYDKAQAAYDLADSKLDSDFISNGFAGIDEITAKLGNTATPATIVISNENSLRSESYDFYCDSTSAQTAINQAISALPENGGKIVLLEGTYNCSGSINVNKPNVTIEGMGMGATVLKYTGGSLIFINMSSSKCTVRDLSVTRDDEAPNYLGVYLNGTSCTECTIDDVEISNFAYGINASQASDTYHKITNVRTRHCQIGIHLNTNRCMVEGAYCTDSTERGINIEGSYNKINNNYVMRGTGQSGDYTSTQHTIYINGGAANNVVTDNYIPGKNYTNNGNDTNVFVNNIFDGEKRGSDKRTATLTMGLSTAGYTADDVDYLCTGTNDQNVINQAIAALPSDGGKIIFLEGRYEIIGGINIENKDAIVFEGMGDATVLSVSDKLASSVGKPQVAFRDLKIDTAGAITRELYSGEAGNSRPTEKNSSVLLDNVTLSMQVKGSEANSYSAFYKTAVNAINSRIYIDAYDLLNSETGDMGCYAIADGGSYGAVFTNCDITLDISDGRIHTGRSNTTMNGCNVHIINPTNDSNQGFVGGIGNTMTGGTLDIRNSDTNANIASMMSDGSYLGVRITAESADSFEFPDNTAVVGCQLHNLTITGDNVIANQKV